MWAILPRVASLSGCTVVSPILRKPKSLGSRLMLGDAAVQALDQLNVQLSHGSSPP